MQVLWLLIMDLTMMYGVSSGQQKSNKSASEASQRSWSVLNFERGARLARVDQCEFFGERFDSSD